MKLFGYIEMQQGVEYPAVLEASLSARSTRPGACDRSTRPGASARDRNQGGCARRGRHLISIRARTSTARWSKCEQRTARR